MVTWVDHEQSTLLESYDHKHLTFFKKFYEYLILITWCAKHSPLNCGAAQIQLQTS